MLPLSTIRDWQIDQMKKAVNTVKRIIQTTTQQSATTMRDGGDGWTVLEVLGHLRDFEEIFFERSRMTVEQDMPDLPFPDPELLVIENDCNAGDLQETFDAWATFRRQHVAFLESVADEGWERHEGWERLANHPIRGPFTLLDQLFLTVWHDLNHIEQMVHILLDD
jgi:uncharacterized damage-inducible protein DinB